MWYILKILHIWDILDILDILAEKIPTLGRFMRTRVLLLLPASASISNKINKCSRSSSSSLSSASASASASPSRGPEQVQGGLNHQLAAAVELEGRRTRGWFSSEAAGHCQVDDFDHGFDHDDHDIKWWWLWSWWSWWRSCRHDICQNFYKTRVFGTKL